MTHRYAEMLGWLQAGQQILGKWRGGAEGHFPVSFNSREVAYAVDGAEGWEFRLKPRTVKIGKVEVEAPVLKATEGQLLWYWDFANSRPTELRCTTPTWDDWLKGGSFFLSAGACEAAHDAVAALLRGEA